MPKYDTVIKNGVIVDGLRNPRVRSDVGIKDGIITNIGALDANEAHCVLDAEGLIVAPGFIDLHTHYDSQLFWDPYCSPSGWHGVTTVVIGNCGYGFSPCRVEDRDNTMLMVSRTESVPLLAMKTGMPWDWVTFPEYVESVNRASKAINVAINLPLNPLLIWVMGAERAKAGVLPTDAEHQEMARLLNEAMDAGAVGFSAQRYGSAAGTLHTDFDGKPLPTDLLNDETMLVLGDVLRKRNEGFIQYLYSDFAESFYKSENKFGAAEQAHPHVEELARRSTRSVLFLPLDIDGGLDWARKCQEQGLPVYAHRFTNSIRNRPIALRMPEDMTILDGFSAAWGRTAVGTLEEIKERFRGSEFRKALRDELNDDFVGPWVFEGGNSPNTTKFKGVALKEIAREWSAPSYIDIFLDIMMEDDLKDEWSIYLRECNLDVFKRLCSHDYWVPGISDGGAHTKIASAAHYGTLFLMTFVREQGWLSLEDAHFRLSSLPAKIAGLESNIGTLAIGAPADILVYDFEQLSITEPRRLHDFPANEWRIADRGVGYRWVLVNGKIIVENDEDVRNFPGRIIHTAQYQRNAVHHSL